MLILSVEIIFAEFVVSCDLEVAIMGWIYPSDGTPDVAEEGLLQ